MAPPSEPDFGSQLIRGYYLPAGFEDGPWGRGWVGTLSKAKERIQSIGGID